MNHPIIPIAFAGATRQRKREAPKGRRVDRQALRLTSSVNAAWISSSRGATVSSNRTPASVGATLRVVLESNATPSRASSSRIHTQSGLGDAPDLRCSAREAFGLRYRDESSQIVQTFFSHL